MVCNNKYCACAFFAITDETLQEELDSLYRALISEPACQIKNLSLCDYKDVICALSHILGNLDCYHHIQIDLVANLLRRVVTSTELFTQNLTQYQNIPVTTSSDNQMNLSESIDNYEIIKIATRHIRVYKTIVIPVSDLPRSDLTPQQLVASNMSLEQIQNFVRQYNVGDVINLLPINLTQLHAYELILSNYAIWANVAGTIIYNIEIASSRLLLASSDRSVSSIRAVNRLTSSTNIGQRNAVAGIHFGGGSVIGVRTKQILPTPV